MLTLVAVYPVMVFYLRFSIMCKVYIEKKKRPFWSLECELMNEVSSFRLVLHARNPSNHRKACVRHSMAKSSLHCLSDDKSATCGLNSIGCACFCHLVQVLLLRLSIGGGEGLVFRVLGIAIRHRPYQQRYVGTSIQAPSEVKSQYSIQDFYDDCRPPRIALVAVLLHSLSFGYNACSKGKLFGNKKHERLPHAQSR